MKPDLEGFTFTVDGEGIQQVEEAHRRNISKSTMILALMNAVDGFNHVASMAGIVAK